MDMIPATICDKVNISKSRYRFPVKSSAAKDIPKNVMAVFILQRKLFHLNLQHIFANRNLEIKKAVVSKKLKVNSQEK